jgi:hypothetical protein
MSGSYDVNYVGIWFKIDLLLISCVVMVLYHCDLGLA